jgi:glutamate 5-kinase
MPSTAVRQRLSIAKRIVVKVGTNAICDARGRLDHRVVAHLAEQIAQLMRQGRRVILVASGAIGAGLAELDLPQRPKELPMLQATAAVGQGQLMRAFHDAFAPLGIKVAQVLVTRDAFEDRRRYLNVRNTLTALGRLGALPIINENDAVAVEEIRFGDNDVISALVANMVGADLLVLLTSVDGLLSEGEVVEVVESAHCVMSLVKTSRSKLGSGGMGSKLTAGEMVTRAGEIAVIANGSTPNVLPRLLAGEKLGTVLLPARTRMSSRRRWIAQAARASGKLMVDDGAIKALCQMGKSLLPSGIRGVMGRFQRGATVAIVDSSGRTIARGLCNYSSEEVDRIKGLKSSQIAKALGRAGRADAEVVHRNNMTLA